MHSACQSKAIAPSPLRNNSLSFPEPPEGDVPSLRPSELALRAIRGENLSANERARLTPSLLAILTTGCHIELTEVERYRLSKAKLVQLCFAEVITLSRRERDRLSPVALAQLVIAGKTRVQPDEFQRLPRSIRELLAASAAKREKRFTAEAV